MKYFKTDGIRGILNEDFDLNFIYNLGRAIGILGRNVIVGRDNRITGKVIKKSLVNGMINNGVRVIDVGICSTPIISFLSKRHNMIGVIITASHNNYKYNGIKIFKNGDKINESDELLVEDSINRVFKIIKGRYIKDYRLKNDYFKLINLSIPSTNKKIVFDFANGALAKIKLKKFKIIGNNSNGKYINKTGVMNLKKIKKYIKRKRCDYGFSFDGDGDRVYLITKKLNVLDGDYLTYLMAIYLKKKGLLKDNLVVLTKISNMGIIKDMEKEGFNVLEVDVGDKYVRSQTKSLGGEKSGHIINNMLFNKGDGLLNALYLIKIIDVLKIDLDSFYDSIEKFYECNINLEGSYNIPDLDDVVKKYLINEDSKVIVRPSGTEKLVRIHVQTQNMNKSKKLSKEIEEYIIRYNR